jgi:hypothetical protein
MTKEQWVELYCRVYAAYEYAALKDEPTRTGLGEVLDHLGQIGQQYDEQGKTNS